MPFAHQNFRATDAASRKCRQSLKFTPIHLDGANALFHAFGIEDADLLSCARFANLRERKARGVLDEVRAAVREWRRFAAEAEVRDDFVTKIETRLNG